MDGLQTLNPLLMILVLERLLDNGDKTGLDDRDLTLLLLLTGTAGQYQMMPGGPPSGAPSAGGGWDTSNPIMLLLLLQLLKRSKEGKTPGKA
jgi:hypothetical protein